MNAWTRWSAVLIHHVANGLAVVLIASILFVSVASAQTPNQKPGVGRVIGGINGIIYEGERPYLTGWACQQGQTSSIQVHVFADDSAKESSKKTFVTVGKADLTSEPGVSQFCQDANGGKHRFRVYLPSQAFAPGKEKRLFVHGIRVVNGVSNDAIAGSGTITFQTPALPALSGACRGLAEHPRVFMTASELKELAMRINRPGSYSKERFAQLAGQIRGDLSSAVDWDAAYSGGEIAIYLHTFSSEPRAGYANEVRSEDQLRVAVNARPGANASAGAAVVASRLALYAALARAGAEIPAGAPSADQAAALAKRILLAWSTHGFQDGHGHFRTAAQFSINPGLQISRGLVYSVQTQDLLMYLGDLSHGEVQQVNAFHGAMYELMRTSHNEGVNYFLSTEFPDQVYSNGFANQLASLLAMARLFDDQKRFDAALYGGEGNDAVRMPWIMFFNHVIYGVSDTPLRPIALKANADPPTGPDYTTAIVAPGEINDRYRNGNAGQGIGYPMFTLERLINAAEVIRVAGFDPYGHRGLHKQSIEMAIAYYACFAKGAGYLKVVTAENAGSCPNAPQYYGKIVNDVDRMVQFGAYRFPNNSAIRDVEAPAKKFALEAATTFSTDAILFGKWRD